MNDEITPPPEEQKPQEPLQYWHSSGTGGPAPLHPVLLGLSAIAGAGVGIGFTSVLVGMGASLFFEIERPARSTIPAICTAVAALLGVGFFIWRTRTKILRERSLALEFRFRGGRFFAIGFLIGCGLACLAEGICFSIVAMNP